MLPTTVANALVLVHPTHTRDACQAFFRVPTLQQTDKPVLGFLVGAENKTMIDHVGDHIGGLGEYLLSMRDEQHARKGSAVERREPSVAEACCQHHETSAVAGYACVCQRTQSCLLVEMRCRFFRDGFVRNDALGEFGQRCGTSPCRVSFDPLA